MSKKTAAAQPPATSSWLTVGLIACFGALFGAGLMYFALRPRQPAPETITVNLPADPTVHRPDPALTAGKAPAEAARTLGNFYYDHQNWAQAIEHYQSAIRQGSDDADIRTDLGNAYRFSNRPDDALLQYQLAQKLNPAHEFSLFNQGGLYSEAYQQPAQAVEIWQTYLQRFPNGRSASAARQLIAQVQGGLPVVPSLPAAGPSPAPTPAASAAENLILRQIEAARTKDAKP
ncbi:tetratricopeptide repeat protein [Oleiharenicola lentus]|uniref:Tetratricopeptide repeat protein n=1 Tax=Oleiharenicola lentus TaxID=2508720 RepID=A0A4Q1CD12_9BACT|nr:tetratricopeptide repeat protein [Oleiharenicola lentus]RXK56812.1 tetratricopeptide repeat protein [Oleiharenicola lentus]